MSPRVWNKREKGVPASAVYVGRPTRWGNPFVIGKDGDRDEVIRLYRNRMEDFPELILAAQQMLRGKDLVCWCAPAPCHADVLLELANAERISEEAPT